MVSAGDGFMHQETRLSVQQYFQKEHEVFQE